MRVVNLIYLSETIIALFTLIIGFIIFRVKHKKGFLKLLKITLISFAILFSTTFILEKPDIDVDNIDIIEAKTNAVMPKITGTYHFKDVTDKVNISGDVDFNKVGEYEVEVKVSTILGLYRKNATIKVVDTTKPEIILKEGEEYKQSYSKEYQEPGYEAIDKYDGDITDKVTIQKEEIDDKNFIIKYEVSDSSGNKAEATRNVLIVDDVPPQLTLNGDSDIILDVNGKYEEQGAKAIDEKDGDLTEKILQEGSVDTSKEGIYKITYKVADSAGNLSIETRTVTVKKQLVATDISAKGGNGNGVIYLTFDDGPSNDITPKILDILKSKNVKATFFILNYSSTGEKLVKREFNEGHTVAIHGYSHVYNDIYKSEDAYMENITKLQEKIKKTTGYNATITRFPGGSSNTVSSFNPGIMTRLCNLVLSKGYKYFDWNISSGDAGGAQSSEEVYNNVTKSLSKSKQNVVLMHDFSGNQKTLNALSDIIDYGIENGYTFSKITEATPMVTHSVNN